MTVCCKRSKVGRAAVDVDVRPVGSGADCDHLGAELLEGGGRKVGVRPVCAVDCDPHAREVRAEPLHDVAQVALTGALEPLDRPALPCGRVEQGFDLLLRRIRQLVALAVEDLDAVVLRGVVRRGDHRPQVLRK